MNLGLLAGVLRARSALRAHELWSRDELNAYQARALRDLREFAVASSPFYRGFHAGLENAPLQALPITTKQHVMERFDEFVTDRNVRLGDVEQYLAQARATSVFRGRYRIAATGGTTGRQGYFLADPHEWRTVLASYSRAYDWAGIRPGLTSRLRMAVVSSRNPAHQSSIVGATVSSALVPTLRLDAMQPLDEIVQELNAFQPEAVVGYASMLRALADEAHANRLAIRPRALMSASEVLTEETRHRIREAFGIRPTNVYAATEPAAIASECRFGHMHRYDDLVIAELVDDDNEPTRSGDVSAKVLATVLFSRTQPLIRYELSDRVEAVDGSCPDGLPFGLIGSIEGRQEEVLQLGGVSVHPNVFHNVLERVDVRGWQVVDVDGRLRVLLAGSPTALDPATVTRDLAEALAGVGARNVPITVERVDAIPRTAMGKAPLIRHEQGAQRSTRSDRGPLAVAAEAAALDLAVDSSSTP